MRHSGRCKGNYDDGISITNYESEGGEFQACISCAGLTGLSRSSNHTDATDQTNQMNQIHAMRRQMIPGILFFR